MNLVQLLLVAPVCACTPDDDDTIHALDVDGVNINDWPNGGHSTACGLPVAHVVPHGDTRQPAPWPCPARLPEGFTRCRECWVATGQRRPRSKVDAA